MQSSTTEWLVSVWGKSPQDVYAVGGKQVFHYDGSAWKEVPLDLQPGSDLRAVWGTNEYVFVVGVNGTVLVYDGNAWAQMESFTSQTLSGVWGRSSDHVLAVGTNGRVQKFGPME
jgi:hypothetical protein